MEEENLPLLIHHHLTPPPRPEKVIQPRFLYTSMYLSTCFSYFQIELLRTTEVDRAKLGNAEKFFVELLGLPK